MFTIYGMRLKDSTEVRYVGQTGLTIEQRRATHIASAKTHTKAGRRMDPFPVWVVQNLAELEFVALDLALTSEEAIGKERQAIQLCLRLNHRLFNRKQSGAPFVSWAEEAA